MKFQVSNPNPSGKKVGDCVVRAISIAENKGWSEVYDSLCVVGSKMFDMPNSKQTYEAYLLENGWKKQRMPKHANGKRYKVFELADLLEGKTAVVSMTRHLCAIKDGCIMDTWFCGQKAVGNYFIK